MGINLPRKFTSCPRPFSVDNMPAVGLNDS